MMTVPLRTAYHTLDHSVSSLSSSYSDVSEYHRSSAPTTPLFKFKGGDEDSDYGKGNWSDEGVVSRESSYEAIEQTVGPQVVDDTASIASVATYASTAPSEARFPEQPQEEYARVPFSSRCDPARGAGLRRSEELMSSSPSDFAFYFPSTRLLHVRHPDDSSDGNMNLSVVTDGWAEDLEGENAPTPVPLTLFHLRMRNLKNRDFSLRRYSRASGREVCHSTRKYTRPAMAKEEQQRLHHRISNALTSFRIRSQPRKWISSISSSTSLKRIDSGYGSMENSNGGLSPRREKSTGGKACGLLSPLATTTIEELNDSPWQSAPSVLPKVSNVPLPSNTTKLEFSNYMHLDLRRRGGRGRGPKRYEFEHWGTGYSWQRRLVHREEEQQCAKSVGESVEFHLYAIGPEQSASQAVQIAHIVPERLSADERAAEDRAGGWVPRCSFWISDRSVVNANNGASLADVIVATGLLALVDDAIKRRWDCRERLVDRMTRSIPARK